MTETRQQQSSRPGLVIEWSPWMVTKRLFSPERPDNGVHTSHVQLIVRENFHSFKMKNGKCVVKCWIFIRFSGVDVARGHNNIWLNNYDYVELYSYGY